ncbi:hypothetical protein BC628DRAFT_1504067 [Trametes gibbosa]|nr:hypothetical protein BC628DRAFT_1504067 [Trametes gibbosa]
MCTDNVGANSGVRTNRRGRPTEMHPPDRDNISLWVLPERPETYILIQIEPFSELWFSPDIYVICLIFIHIILNCCGSEAMPDLALDRFHCCHEIFILNLKQQLEEATARLAAVELPRDEAQRRIEEQATALREAEVQIEAAQAAAASAQVASAMAQAPRAAQAAASQFMGVEKDLYIDIRVSPKVHAAEFSAQGYCLAWDRDFWHQDVNKLANLFSAAAEEYPILKRYSHHWATAAIATRYMQNLRRHAREKGLIPSGVRYNRSSVRSRH